MENAGVYSNLIGEIAKSRICNADIASALRIHPNTFRNKLNGESSFSVEEAFTIKRTFFPEKDLTYLFDRSPH